jgi:hypothetical protein
MDNETYLKEMAKHVQRNTTKTKGEDSSRRKIQIKTFKAQGEYERLVDSIDTGSLELYRQMMKYRYGNLNEEE